MFETGKQFDKYTKIDGDLLFCKMLYEMRKREKIVECLGVRY